MAGKTGNILALYDVLYRRTDEDHPLTMREIQDEMVEMGYNCSEDTILRHMRLLNGTSKLKEAWAEMPDIILAVDC